MTEAQPRAFMLSATLHAAAAAIVLFFTYAVSRNSEPPKIIELVAGPGDDIMAREAPAAGREGGAVKVPLNTPQPQPEPQPQPVAPVQPEPPPPVTKAPPPQPAKTTPVPTDAPVPNFKKQITQDVRNADRKAKRELAKQHAEEEKQKQAEKKRQEEEAKKMSKEDFDKKYGKNAKVASASPKNPTVKKIDVDGIVGGVNGGSSASKKGAGGKALKNDNDDVMAAYYALIQQKLRKEFEPPPGLADTLKVDIELWSNADGSLTKVRVAKSSGSKEFDQSVLDAIRRMKMPARPDKKSEEIVFTFTMRERGEG